jgi:hypothetical protein
LHLSYTNHHISTGAKKKKFERNITNCWGIRKPREKKYQPPQNYNPRFRTHKSNKINKNKNYKPSNNTYHKIHKSNQRAKGEKNCIFYTQTTTEAQGQKKNLSAASPIVGAVGSGEFK